VSRIAIALLALLIAAAAPARVWCEASCLVPPHHGDSSKPHCPGHDQSTGASIASADAADCPTIEAARPVAAMIAVAPALAVIAPSTSAPRHLKHPGTPGTQAPRHPVPVPLRI